MLVELELEVRLFDSFIKVFVRNIFLIDIIIDRDMTPAFMRIDFAPPNLMERVQSSITDCGRFDETLIKKSSQLQDFPFASNNRRWLSPVGSTLSEAIKSYEWNRFILI